MNSVLLLKGRFESRKANRPNGPSFPKDLRIVDSDFVPLCDQLEKLLSFWGEQPDIGGVLVSVYYKRIVAKSNRILSLLTDLGKKPSETICGAKFNANGNKHIFTHYVSVAALRDTIVNLQRAMEIVRSQFGGKITLTEIETIRAYGRKSDLPKTTFLEILHDVAYVERFGLDSFEDVIEQEAIVSLYKTNLETKRLLSKYGITIFDDRILNQTTVRLSAGELQRLKLKAPYLIAMGLTDFRDLALDDADVLESDYEPDEALIPAPHDEPVVGVIDTQFDTSVYFSEWVEYSNELDENIQLERADFWHGTSVSSIIVDGPKGNPHLDDGCGRFRVRHFGVAKHHGFSTFAILRMIRDIVSRNTDIKVWNLSLGSSLQINPNFISPEAAELDLIQSEYDVLFVIAGTNVPNGVVAENMRLGAPADSLNSIVVNSVTFDNKPASYTRIGPVLSFFNKPDVCYYGGDGRTAEECIAVCRGGVCATYVKGTSYAAPWIARKAAYLIHIMGLSREVAKALLIDSAAQWNQGLDMPRKGYGIVPIHINNVINSDDDEIRFVIYGTADEYETHNYNLPVPHVEQAYPFFARATLVYFPHCNRNQGVDYSGAELDIAFGRIEMKKGGTPGIRTINNNWQTEEGHYTMESDARKLYRKWDNVKHIGEIIKNTAHPKKILASEFWGISVKSKSRENNGRREPLPFGIVITLKEMRGVNRFEDFISLCQVRGWLVERLDVRNRLDIYVRAEEEVQFE